MGYRVGIAMFESLCGSAERAGKDRLVEQVDVVKFICGRPAAARPAASALMAGGRQGDVAPRLSEAH